MKDSNNMKKLFEKGGKLEKFYPVYEMFESMLFVTARRTETGAHIRDSFDIKRLMFFVIIAGLPALFFGMYNAGYQHYISQGMAIGSQVSHLDCFLRGAYLVIPLIIICYAVGGFWEILFAIVRKEEVNEGLFVTGFLIPCIVPPTLPWWQLAVAVTFGVVIGKELFGGTGMNVFNPALVTRAFLFFAYPGQISGNEVWIDFGSKVVDSFTAATPLAVAMDSAGGSIVDILAAKGYTWWNMFTGLIPGSVAETSTLLILIGGLFLILTGVGSWRIMISVFAGGFVMAGILNYAAPSPSSFLALPFSYHMVMGGFAFGAVFMATDPVSAAGTNTGKYIYGFFIGLLAILIRVLNPAYPEGMMLSILFMNAFAPLIDHVIVSKNIRRRKRRAAN